MTSMSLGFLLHKARSHSSPSVRRGYRLAGGNISTALPMRLPSLAGFLGSDSPLALTLLGQIKEALVVVGRGAGEAHRGPDSGGLQRG